MEKIRLKDGTTFDIISGSEEYVNIIAPSVDEVVKHFTDENLVRCEILGDVTETVTVTEDGVEEVARASFSDKRMKSVAVDVVDGGYDIVITFEDAVVDVNEILNILTGGASV